MPVRAPSKDKRRKWTNRFFEQTRLPNSAYKDNDLHKAHWRNKLIAKVETLALRQQYTDALTQAALLRDWDKVYDLAVENKHFQFTKPKVHLRTRELKLQIIREYDSTPTGKKHLVLAKHGIEPQQFYLWRKAEKAGKLQATYIIKHENAQLPDLDEAAPSPSEELYDPRPKEDRSDEPEPSEAPIEWSPWQEL